VTIWHWILLASILVYALKLSGYLVPARVLERPPVARTANLMTVGLLAALVVTQTLGAGTVLVADARIPALVVAAVLFAVRAPFIVAVTAAAVVAALLRMTGWG